MNKFVAIGTFAKAHGLNGKIKVLSHTNLKEKVFQIGQKLYVGASHTPYVIRSYQKSGVYDLIMLQDLTNLDLINPLLNQTLYVNIAEINLGEEEYLESELIGATVMENDEKLGIGLDIEEGKYYNYLKVKGEKEFLIPLVKTYILAYDRDKNTVKVSNAKALIM